MTDMSTLASAENVVDAAKNCPPTISEPIAELIAGNWPEFEWPSCKYTYDRKGNVTGVTPHKHSLANVGYHLRWHGVLVNYNVFTNRHMIGGAPLTDQAVRVLWFDAKKRGLPDQLHEYHTAVETIAESRHYHPVIDYLDSLTWDGKPRVDTWLQTYLGAEDAPINREFGRVTLLGACARVLRPGCKFDTMLVLLSPEQGKDKSSTIDVLGGDWFSDNFQLGLNTARTVEQTTGKWLIEVPELHGMAAFKVDQIKAQLSRRVDTCRPAWGRAVRDYPRQFILIGTTNNRQFLKDPTGNRRFLPVEVHKPDLAALKRDRDQLWAEAYTRAKRDEPTTIPETLWKAASEVQEGHRDKSTFEEAIVSLIGDVDGGILLKTELWEQLELRHKAYDRSNQRLANQLTATVQRLGWRATERKRDGKNRYVYAKEPETWLKWEGGAFKAPQTHDEGQTHD